VNNVQRLTESIAVLSRIERELDRLDVPRKSMPTVGDAFVCLKKSLTVVRSKLEAERDRLTPAPKEETMAQKLDRHVIQFWIREGKDVDGVASLILKSCCQGDIPYVQTVMREYGVTDNNAMELARRILAKKAS
jgi:hypothetical protein